MDDAYTVERALLLLTFGENVRGLRKQRGLAQEGLAEVASLHWNEIGVIERGGARFKASDGLRYIDDALDLIAL
jgi:hypothetical protein